VGADPVRELAEELGSGHGEDEADEDEEAGLGAGHAEHGLGVPARAKRGVVSGKQSGVGCCGGFALAGVVNEAAAGSEQLRVLLAACSKYMAPSRSLPARGTYVTAMVVKALAPASAKEMPARVQNTAG
jgi:hypothetical protein